VKSLITNLLSSGRPIALSAAMQIAKITVHGLTSIAILVALLWTCVISQRVMLGRANAGTAQVLRAMRELRMKNRGAGTLPAQAVRSNHAPFRGGNPPHHVHPDRRRMRLA
jgi:hypothetical protein